MKLLLSTLTSPQSVCVTKKADNGTSVIVKRILIKGGANVIDKRTLETPQGVVTELSDEDFETLSETDFYKRMVERGFLRPVSTRKSAEDTEKVGMNKKDKSAQKKKRDFTELERPEPMTV